MDFVLYQRASDCIHDPEAAQVRSILMTDVLHVTELSLRSVSAGPKQAF
jgi:hypothetical protein